MKYHTYIWVICILIALFAISIVKHLYLPFTPDNAVHVFAARIILENGSLYPYFFETNPPLFPYLTILPVIASQIFGGSAFFFYFFMVYLVAALSLFIVAREINRIEVVKNKTELTAILTIWALLFVGLQGFDLGQRDHMTAILVFPYVVNLATRLSRPQVYAVSMPAAILLAIGIAIKPHYFAIWMLGEIAACIANKDRRSLLSFGNFTIIAIGMLYIGLALILEPYFFSEILPVLRTSYGVIGHPLSQGALWLWLDLTFVQAVVMRMQFKQANDQSRSWRISLCTAFMISSQGAFVGYLLQAHFPYQIWPFIMLSLAPLALLFLPGESRSQDEENTGVRVFLQKIRNIRPQLAIVVSIGAAILATPWWMWQEMPRVFERNDNRDALWAEHYPRLQSQIQAIDHLAEGGSYYVFSTNVSTIFPAASYVSGQWNFRYPVLWPLPAIAFAEEGEGRASDIAQDLIKQMVEDFERHKPDVVLVDVSRRKSFFPEDEEGIRSFDYLKFFNRSHSFRKEFSKYVICGSYVTAKQFEFDVYLSESWVRQHPERCSDSALQLALGE